jgi:hypothetical protein
VIALGPTVLAPRVGLMSDAASLDHLRGPPTPCDIRQANRLLGRVRGSGRFMQFVSTASQCPEILDDGNALILPLDIAVAGIVPPFEISDPRWRLVWV